MSSFNRIFATSILAWALGLFAAQAAHGHLMIAQHGTLNFVDDGIFMVLSLPMSAFEGIDDDKDGKVSMLEFNRHRRLIVESITRHVVLSHKQEIVPLQGVMLSPVTPHVEKDDALSQLIVTGRFALEDRTDMLHLYIGLYGKFVGESSLKITATRLSDNRRHVFELTPIASERAVFPTPVRL